MRCRQAADVVVALDRRRRAAGERHALDHVGIERALRQKLDRPLAVAGDAARLGLERVDEQLADRLALGLRVFDAFQRLYELLRCVDMNERDVEMAAEQVHHFIRFTLAHEPVVDEHADEPVADRLVDHDRGNRGIDAARQAADDARLADLRTDAGDLLVTEGGHGPVAFKARDLEQEIGDELRAVGRVNDLGMEHCRVVAARFVGGDGVGRVLRHCIDAEAFGQTGHAIAVAHPHRVAAARSPHAVEQGARREDLDIRPAEFRGVPGLHLAAKLLAQGLLAVADGRIGTPLVKISTGACGLPASGTDAGPPDRITALGFSRANASPAFEKGWISQ